jgi:HEAT repeat protein
MRRIVLVMVFIWLSGCSRTQPAMAGSKWADALHDADAKVRKKAAFTLGNIGPTDPAVLPALLGALKDADAGVRCEAILALLKCGPEAKDAVPVLQEMERHDPDQRTRRYAAEGREKLQRDS